MPRSPRNKSRVGAHDAKTNFGQLLNRVARGEVIVITRHGEPIARLIPFEEEVDRYLVRENIAALNALSARIHLRGVKLTQEEIKASQVNGRP